MEKIIIDVNRNKITVEVKGLENGEHTEIIHELRGLGFRTENIDSNSYRASVNLLEPDYSTDSELDKCLDELMGLDYSF